MPTSALAPPPPSSAFAAPTLRDPATLPFDDYDIVTRITRDHEAFKDTVITYTSPGLAPSEKLAAAQTLVKMAAAHANAEEMVLYPLARTFLPDGEHATDADLEFHRRLRHELSALSWSSAEPFGLDEKLTRAWATLSRHTLEEESLLSAIARYVPLERRIAAGRLFASVKLLACTRPTSRRGRRRRSTSSPTC